MLEWLIIGGGVHGTALSLALTNRDGVPRDRVRILDPYEQPLHYWGHFTTNVGMAYLRSPGVHHLHYDPWRVRTFRETRRGKPLSRSVPRFERPSLAFFNTFTQLLLDRYHLRDLRLQGRAHALTRLKDGWQVETDAGALQARRVLLAIGNSESLNYPAWIEATAAATHHIFDPQFDRTRLPHWDHMVVVGGGISAGQTALALAAHQPGAVTLLTRHPLRIHDFDSAPCWVSNLCLADFHREPDPGKRRQMITAARYSGSMPYDIEQQVLTNVQAGSLRLLVDEVAHADGTELHLTSGKTLSADQIVLCTGFRRERPGGYWLDSAIHTYNLPLAPDGYPLVDQSLCWTDGLYVTGPLAELEIGPVARNIIGARLASERIRRVS